MTGCYTTLPLHSMPASGSEVVLDLNDRGRVALGDRIGPSASVIDGEIETPNDTAYALRVKSVRYLNGQSNQWSGERLTVPANLVSQATQRNFSRARTVALSAGLATALALFIKGVSLFGNSSGSPGGGSPTPPPGSS